MCNSPILINKYTFFECGKNNGAYPLSLPCRTPALMTDVRTRA